MSDLAENKAGNGSLWVPRVQIANVHILRELNIGRDSLMHGDNAVRRRSVSSKSKHFQLRKKEGKQNFAPAK
jgi:hypothetical protein